MSHKKEMLFKYIRPSFNADVSDDDSIMRVKINVSNYLRNEPFLCALIPNL